GRNDRSTRMQADIDRLTSSKYDQPISRLLTSEQVRDVTSRCYTAPRQSSSRQLFGGEASAVQSISRCKLYLPSRGATRGGTGAQEYVSLLAALAVSFPCRWPLSPSSWTVYA